MSAPGFEASGPERDWAPAQVSGLISSASRIVTCVVMEDLGVGAFGSLRSGAEDEYLLAEDLFVGVRARRGGDRPLCLLAEVCNAVDNEPKLDAAVLDINLYGEFVYSAADRLRMRGTPFVFATIHGPDTIAERFKDVPRGQKTVGAKRALALIEALPGPRPGSETVAARSLAS
jgi:hypothetical protein